MKSLSLTPALRSRIFAALIGAGVAGPSAYVATNTTVTSEGFYTSPYADPAGLKTWCIGHLAKKGEVAKKVYTVDECISIFVEDWVEHERLLDSYVKVPYRSAWMKGALTDFTFNKGVGNLASSTLLKQLNAKNYDQACMELTKWVYATVGGKKVVLKGLQIRASMQYQYCMGNIPANYSPMLIGY